MGLKWLRPLTYGENLSWVEGSGGSREGAPGARPPLILDQTEAQKPLPNFFQTAPLTQSLDDSPPFLSEDLHPPLEGLLLLAY